MMTCQDGECGFYSRCPFHGASPIETETGSIACVLISSERRGDVVAIPAAVIVGKTGKVEQVLVRHFEIKRPLWKRMFWRADR